MCTCTCMYIYNYICLLLHVFPSLPTDKPPTLPELICLDVPQEVGAHSFNFGIILLNDETGSRMESIEDECRGKNEKITRQILREWLKGSGLPVTWKTLVETLRKAKLNEFADKIEAEKRL